MLKEGRVYNIFPLVIQLFMITRIHYQLRYFFHLYIHYQEKRVLLKISISVTNKKLTKSTLLPVSLVLSCSITNKKLNHMSTVTCPSCRNVISTKLKSVSSVTNSPCRSFISKKLNPKSSVTNPVSHSITNKKAKPYEHCYVFLQSHYYQQKIKPMSRVTRVSSFES